ncbi:glycine/betaine ABC transporter permease [Candidatus Borreliella tachyglossi]|uniref:Glycine/betaine ABC transporter permease n=1 Tax=Candidatus Borreliella tachyglossi TaxID=1964448 RepID=A0A2S1LW60_9SPIR|nr:proline/glycine betaine ABC transporter permease [Candidatus Borreliella tachyglossi]AWG42539.1 glycine/betaine ABC transporter permease [Candidatus Borreliella tachyglossi]
MNRDIIVSNIDRFFNFLVDNFSDSNGIGFTKIVILFYENLKDLFLFIPPVLFIIIICVLSFLFLKKRLALLIMLGFCFVLYFNLWEASMDTVSIIFVSVLFSVILGLPVGILGGYYPRFYIFLKPVLDLMQAMPPFIYLIPAIPFFGMGTSSAIFATIIFAMPPVIRYTRLGIVQVPGEVIEAAKSFGSSNIRILFQIQLPLSLQSIIEGINQSIMMAISMIVIAAMVGSSGLGRTVIYSVERLNFGEGLISGLAVVVIAIILDRIMQAIFIKFSYLNTDHYGVKKENKFKRFLEIYNK